MIMALIILYLINRIMTEVTYFLENVLQCKKSNQISYPLHYQIKDEILWFQNLYIVLGKGRLA